VKGHSKFPQADDKHDYILRVDQLDDHHQREPLPATVLAAAVDV